jgi:hypothetical protein
MRLYVTRLVLGSHPVVSLGELELGLDVPLGFAGPPARPERGINSLSILAARFLPICERNRG